MNDTIDLPDPSASAAPALDAAARKALRAQAHPLKPVVMIGDAGLTPAVLAEIDRALGSHQLIKVRVLGDDREARDRLLAEIASRTGSAPVQHIGKLLVFWRPAPAAEQELASPTGRARPRGPYQPKKAAAVGKASAARPVRAGSAGGRAKRKPADTARPLARGAGLAEAGGRPAAARSGASSKGASSKGASSKGTGFRAAGSKGAAPKAAPKTRTTRRGDAAGMPEPRPRRPGRSPALPSPAARPGRSGPRR
jgi:RNA-binding protein